jgi:DNA-binding transcriptional ArsR family regulator
VTTRQRTTRKTSRETRDFGVPISFGTSGDYGTPGETFDTINVKLRGLDLATLSDAERAEYDKQRADFVHCCEALLASAEKRTVLELHHRVALRWSNGPGRDKWLSTPTDAFMRVHGLATGTTAVTTARARETTPRRRRGDATSRGGSSGDKPRSSDDDVGRPARAVSNGDGRPLAAQWRTSIIASDLGATDRLVAFILLTHAERNADWCSPSIRTFERETGLSRPTIIAALRRLDRAGFVERECEGRGKPTRYRISGQRRLPLSEGA